MQTFFKDVNVGPFFHQKVQNKLKSDVGDDPVPVKAPCCQEI